MSISKKLITIDLLLKTMKTCLLWPLIVLGFISCKKNTAPVSSSIVLKANWEFKQANKTKWMKATVPGTVHQDLMSNGVIKDPFLELNEYDVQWIENEDWEYRTKFTVTKEQLAQENKELLFKGLDTYADVYLNDSLILTADNMFRSWEANCRNLLKEGNNELRILFKSPVRIGQEKLNKLGFLIPVQNEQAPKGKQNSVFTRKAAYHFGWDWGPRLVTAGLWQPVLFKTWSNAKIKDVYLQQKSLTKEMANYTAHIEISASKDGEAALEISVDGKTLKNQKASLKKGNNTLSVDVLIDKPDLWWGAGLGNQKLYE